MAVIPPEDPLIDALREAQATPDPARAQALEDRLTARLQQLASNSERKSNMQAQLTYTRRPSAYPVRAWGNIAAIVTLAACVALVIIAFPRQTPPDDLNAVAPIGVDQDPTVVAMTTNIISMTVTPTPLPFVTPTSTAYDGGSLPTMPPMTATPIPVDMSSQPFATPTPTPLNPSEFRPTTIPLETDELEPIITIEMSRLFYVQPVDFQVYDLQIGQRLAFFMPVVTVTDLPDANLMSLLPAGVVELVYVSDGYVMEVDPANNQLTVRLIEPLNIHWASWARNPDANGLIAYNTLE